MQTGSFAANVLERPAANPPVNAILLANNFARCVPHFIIIVKARVLGNKF